MAWPEILLVEVPIKETVGYICRDSAREERRRGTVGRGAGAEIPWELDGSTRNVCQSRVSLEKEHATPATAGDWYANLTQSAGRETWRQKSQPGHWEGDPPGGKSSVFTLNVHCTQDINARTGGSDDPIRRSIVILVAFKGE